MSTRRKNVALALLATSGVCAALIAIQAAPSPAQPAGADAPASGDQLRAEVKRLEGLLPDQAAVMTYVGYHFSNLWFALESENWPLADFYLNETQKNVRWAVRVKPIRKDSAGRDIDLAGIAQSIDNTQFADLKKAIAAKEKDLSVKFYQQSMEACYACHQGIGQAVPAAAKAGTAGVVHDQL